MIIPFPFLRVPPYFIVAFLMSFVALGQQVADTLYHPPVPNPAYKEGLGPVISIDEAHTNFHTLSGRYKPFAQLISRDGYVVKAFREPFTKAGLAAVKILVIANALHPDNRERWSLPTPSAFSENEIGVVNQWVKDGGSLFLIADHMPFPGAAENLAASFGFKLYNGFARKKGLGGKDIFKIGKGLSESPLTKGRNASEAVSYVQTFTGQAFQIPEKARPVITLDNSYEILLPQTAGQFDKDTQRISGEKLVQGAYIKYGEGRLVVFGEAAMFSAQLQGKNKMGMNERSADQNAQFLLNVIHWLDGKLE